MRLNNKTSGTLVKSLFKSYIIQCSILTASAVLGTYILTNAIIGILKYFYGEMYFMYISPSWIALFGVIVWGVSIIGLTYKLLKKVVAYVYELQGATEKLFDKDVENIELSPELAEVALKVNALKQKAEKSDRRLQENEQRKKELIMYLAHDLKTPLSSVIGYLNLLRDETEITMELREKYVSIALNKAERLEELINEFFEITRFNLSEITLQYSKINLRILLEQLVYDFRPILKDKKLNCELQVPDDIVLHCDANKIQRVFDNLLRNATIYSFADTTIYISAARQDEQLEIHFLNYGDTIPKEKLSQIFEQFYRLDTARSTTSGGAGLGLAIAKQIAELHGGTISAESQDETIEVTVTLPLS